MAGKEESGIAEAAIMDGSAWRNFCMQLADAGEAILRPDAPATLFDRTEGFRHLTRLIRVGLIQNLEAADPAFPFFYRPSDEITKYGGDNPDNVYWSSMIDGRHDYRIIGNRGTMKYWSIGTKAFRMEIDGTILSTGELRGEEIDWPTDGNFEMIVSAKPQPPGVLWLPATATTNFILMRQTYLDRESEVPGTYRIERIGAQGEAPAPLTAQTLVSALERASRFVKGNVLRFGDFIAPVMPHVNRIADIDQQHMFAAGGDPAIQYVFSRFVIGPDEAYVIRVVPPECEMWNFALYNYWLESFDYVNRPVSLNDHSAKRGADGSITIVIANTNPGVHNWVDACGHGDGIALFRWNNAVSLPVTTTRVVKLSELTAMGR